MLVCVCRFLSFSIKSSGDLAPSGTPGWGLGGRASTAATRREGLGARDVPRRLGHVEALAGVLAGVLVVHGPGGLLVLLHPLPVGHVLDVLLLHDLEVVDAVLHVVVISGHHDQRHVRVPVTRQTNVDLEKEVSKRNFTKVSNSPISVSHTIFKWQWQCSMHRVFMYYLHYCESANKCF